MTKFDRIETSMASAEATLVCTPARRSSARQPRFTTTPEAPTAANLTKRELRNGWINRRGRAGDKDADLTPEFIQSKPWATAPPRQERAGTEALRTRALERIS